MKKIQIEKEILEENKDFFHSFSPEALTSNKNNKKLLSEFVSKKKNNSLESYLRNDAWDEDLNGETRVYLVKDKEGKVAAYFSIKCGLIVGENLDEKLTDDQLSFVDGVIMAIKANDKEMKENMYAAGIELFPDYIDQLFAIAQRKADRKTESIDIHQEDNTLAVPNCMSAIEIRHFCKNEQYVVNKNIMVPLGFGIFWEIIIPKIIRITEEIGCKYIYIFAADKSEVDSKETRNLISYYKTEYKFRECDDEMKFVKPDYDEHCYGLIQDVKMLAKNREAVWDEFSDV